MPYEIDPTTSFTTDEHAQEHLEGLLEDCLIEAEENFRVHNQLTQKQVDELLAHPRGGVRDAITKQAQRLFDDRCQ